MRARGRSVLFRCSALILLLPHSLPSPCRLRLRCAPSISKQALQVTDVSSGWFDVGVVERQEQARPERHLQAQEERGRQPVLGLAQPRPSCSSKDQEHERRRVRAERPVRGKRNRARSSCARKWGYTADPPQTRAEMLQNSQFRDMEVHIFAKQSSSQWVELQRVPIARQLLTQ